MIWKIWKYALGSFADDKTRDYDNVVAIVRTIILFTYFTTNIFIISGVIRHWNNASTKIPTPQQESTKAYQKATSFTGSQETCQNAH